MKLRQLALVLLTTATAVTAPAVASAKVFDLYAQIEGGGGSGAGVAGLAKDQDFFGSAQGGAYGAKLGVELLFTDVWVEHWQFTDGSVVGTWTQFMLGGDIDFKLGDVVGEDGKPLTTGAFAELGLAIGYGLGTGKQVEPPLDNAELSDKGFIAQLSLGVDYRLNKVMSLGVAVPITYGYLFKTGNGVVANDEANQYQQLAATGLIYVRLSLGLGK